MWYIGALLLLSLYLFILSLNLNIAISNNGNFKSVFMSICRYVIRYIAFNYLKKYNISNISSFMDSRNFYELCLPLFYNLFISSILIARTYDLFNGFLFPVLKYVLKWIIVLITLFLILKSVIYMGNPHLPIVILNAGKVTYEIVFPRTSTHSTFSDL